jgi:hypothetical protein
MTSAPPFICLQISPPEARPSRLRALRAQRRDNRRAPKALHLTAAANGQSDGLPSGAPPRPGASPPTAGSPDQEDPR